MKPYLNEVSRVSAPKSFEFTIAVEQRFGLATTPDSVFFSEWRAAQAEATPQPSELRLACIKAYFNYLLRTPPFFEGAVKMVVLSPGRSLERLI